MDLIGSYPFVVSTVLFLTTIPYGFLLMKHNVDLKKLDLLRRNFLYLEKLKDNPKKINTVRWAIVILFMAMGGSFALPHMVVKYYFLHQSEIFFFMVILAVPLYLSMCSWMMLYFFSVYYQRTRNLLN